MPKGTSLKDMILSRLIAATPEDTLREVAIDANLAKALYGPEVGAEGQERPSSEASDRVVDQSPGAMGTKTPSREEIKVGPAQEASGGGAERMIREYSHPDSQQAVVMQYEKLSGMMGDLSKSMKAMSDAFTALLAKAEDEHEEAGKKEHEEEEKEGHKSQDLASEFLDDILAKAEDEEEKEEEHEKHEAEKALPASSKLSLAKALFEAVQAARKAKVPSGSRSRVLKAAAAALRRAYRMAKAADAEGVETAERKEARKAVAAIAEFAFLRDIPLTVAVKAEEEEKKEEEKEAAKAEAAKDEEDHNQKVWPTGKKSVPGLDEVLKGQAVLNGNIMSMLDALSGKGGNLPATDLGLMAKAVGGEGQNPKALFKSNPAAWEVVKRDQIQAAVDSGEFQLSDELAAGTILATAQAVQHGAVEMGMLKARVGTASEAVRALFSEILEA
jgi:hypothetical protein